MQKGKIKFYNKARKFGFIVGDDGNDYFFHELGLLNSFENIVAINFNHRWLGSFSFLFISFAVCSCF